MSEVAVIGGGAAGLLCACQAAAAGHQVTVYERNDRIGKKLFITGKGRCNLTNGCEDPEEFLDHIITNKKFMYSSFYSFTNLDTIRWFEERGLTWTAERGGRIFPASGHSSDVIRILSKELLRLGVRLLCGSRVKELRVLGDRVGGIVLEDGRIRAADAVVIATGGLSYPLTGATGDGYRMAEAAGHTLTPLSPALVPMEIAEDYAKELKGLSLRNIEISLKQGKRELYRGFGEMIFTHYGISGPLILSASSYVPKYFKEPLRLAIDLKPALSCEQLDARILREFEANKNKQFKNAVGALFPAKLIPVMVKRSRIPPEKKVHEITRAEREGFLALIKDFPLTVKGLRGYDEAVITRGGVRVLEVNPKTMESKLVSGLYFAGEVLDVDALTGGYNLQVAWSTAWMAGNNIE